MKFYRKILNQLLAHLARKVIKKYQPKIIGITGSVGKTSTRQAIFELFKKKHFNVRTNIKNYNTEIGIPLTIINCHYSGRNPFRWLVVWFRALKLIWGLDETYPEILILEMAADHPGDIAHLVKIAPCDIAIVTAVSEVHLEFFNSLEAIVQEKQNLVSNLGPDNWAVLNKDESLVDGMSQNTSAQILTYGFFETADLRVFDFTYHNDDLGNFSHISFKLNYHGITVPVSLKNIIAKHQVYSFLAAVAVGLIFKMNLVDIIKVLKDFSSPPGRMNLIDGIKQTKIIDDSYNSSPKAVVAALEVLAKLYASGKKIAVLGDMLELGSFSEKAHYQIGQKVCQLAVDILVTIGERARDIARGAQAAGMSSSKIFEFADSAQAGRFVQEQMAKGDLVLVKGSQGVRTEKIVKEIMAEPLQADKLLVRQYGRWLVE